MKEPQATPPSTVEKAFSDLFQDHAELSDFIFRNRGILTRLEDLRALARSGDAKHASHEVSVWLRRFAHAMRDEVRELEESIPWKWWRGENTDLQNVRVELVDIFHFLVSAAQIAGLTGEDFIRIYYQKRRINYDRQVTGFKDDDNKGIVV